MTERPGYRYMETTLKNGTTGTDTATAAEAVRKLVNHHYAAVEFIDEIEDWARSGNTHNGKCFRFPSGFKADRHTEDIVGYVEQELGCHVTVTDVGLFIIAAA